MKSRKTWIALVLAASVLLTALVLAFSTSGDGGNDKPAAAATPAAADVKEAVTALQSDPTMQSVQQIIDAITKQVNQGAVVQREPMTPEQFEAMLQLQLQQLGISK